MFHKRRAPLGKLRRDNRHLKKQKAARKAAREKLENITINARIKEILEHVDTIEGSPNDDLNRLNNEESPVDPLEGSDTAAELEKAELAQFGIPFQTLKCLVRPISIEEMRAKYLKDKQKEKEKTIE